MHKSFPNFILFLVPILLTVSCGRTDMIRIRIMAPVTEKKQDLSLLSDNLSTSPKVTLSDPKTSGASIYLMLGSIGFGTTSLNTTLEKETRSKSNDAQLLKETTSINARFNDLAFVIGEDYTFMWGFGAFGGGSVQTKLDYGSTGGYSSATDETLESDYLGGHSTFIILGHHGSGFETLLGYRTNEIKAEMKSTGTSARTLHNNGTIELKDKGIHLKTSQVTLGFGFTF